MSTKLGLGQWRDWFPIPSWSGEFNLIRWVTLDANRLAVTGALITLVFATFMGVASYWTFEMQVLLRDTPTVQTILNTFLSGMILLVSIVVSINSIVLSHDITSVEDQEDRIEGEVEFRQKIGKLARPEENPSEPSAFLAVMSRAIKTRAEALTNEMDELDPELTEEIEEYVALVSDAANELGTIEETSGAEFALLWKGIGFDHGPYIDESRRLVSNGPESTEAFDELIEVFKLFAVGKEYFKTLYYAREVSQFSRTLLVVALPAILFNASTILAINGGRVLPDGLFLGLPPLQTFMAVAFAISITPYLVLTSYVLRLSTVARMASSQGIFSL